MPKGRKGRGRSLVLATASDQRMAQAVADHVGLFDVVLASDGERNLKGPTKAAATVTDVRQRFAPPPRPAALLRALRPHQWVKNLRLFLPLVAAHQLGDGPALLAASLAFLVFGLTASSVYLLNDLLDLPADRAHPRKCQRPFAAGTLPLAWGVLLSPLLLLAALGLSLLFLPTLFTLVLGGYYLLTTTYSFGLKRKPVVDVLLLAALYTVRVIAGAAAVAIVPSFWLLAFSMFIFLSLALAKRYTELDSLRRRGELTVAGRGWHVDDLPLVQTLGTGAGLACVLVLALYIDSAPARQLYATPQAGRGWGCWPGRPRPGACICC
ncbi:UbiA family prenyltransferase [Thiohalocapsa marina]|uniref:UbiA family prenyltransferase n=1 Tax=Thiohalocapsa marina TaxID=424902 RepID=UPI0036DEA72F